MDDRVKLMLVLMYRHGRDAPAHLDHLASGFRSVADHEQAAMCVETADRIRRCYSAMAAAREA